jgi:hypothetical protein
MGFLLERVVPDDLLAFSELFAVVGWQPGGTLAPLDFAILFLGHTVKWPPAARHMAALVRQDRALIPSERRYIHGSDGLVCLYRAVIEWCVGAQWGGHVCTDEHRAAGCADRLGERAALGLFGAGGSQQPRQARTGARARN